MELIFFMPGMCIGESNNCVGVNMGGLPGWTDASAYIFPSEFIHNMFTPSCVGWGGGNRGPNFDGAYIMADATGTL
jgi:hypothetical protein